MSPLHRSKFVKSLQALPPGTKSLIVDENYPPKTWPPSQRPTNRRTRMTEAGAVVTWRGFHILNPPDRGRIVYTLTFVYDLRSNALEVMSCDGS